MELTFSVLVMNLDAVMVHRTGKPSVDEVGVMVLGPDDGFLGVLCVKCTRIPKASSTQALVLHSGIPVGVLVHRCQFCSQRKWKSSGLGKSVALHNLIAEMTSV